jgi:hypothetical protein
LVASQRLDCEGLSDGGQRSAVARPLGSANGKIDRSFRAGARPDDVIQVRRSTGKRPYEIARPEVWPALENLVDLLTVGARNRRFLSEGFRSCSAQNRKID